MKMIPTLLLLLTVVANSLGAISKTDSIEPEFIWNTNTLSYNAIGIGSTERALRFMSNNIVYMAIGVYTQDGGGGFEDIRLPRFYPNVETLSEFIARNTKSEFSIVAGKYHYDLNQTFSIHYFFIDGFARAQFYNEGVSFHPDQSGSIPESFFETPLKLSPRGDGMMFIPYRGVKRATVLVLDKRTDKFISYTDSIKSVQSSTKEMWVLDDEEVAIPRKLVTNETYRIILTVETRVGSEVYDEGNLVVYPQSIPPIVGITMTKTNAVVSVYGSPKQNIYLLSYSNLNLPPIEKVLTLNNVGSCVMTNAIESSIFILKVGYSSSTIKP